MISSEIFTIRSIRPAFSKMKRLFGCAGKKRQSSPAIPCVPLYSGTAYPDQPTELSELMRQRIGRAQGEANTVAIAAPHASPDGGWETYRAAYQAMPSPEAAQDTTIVILGTSHYGAPDRFGLTRKPYVTPYGAAPTDVTIVNELIEGAPDAVRLEDYCHAVEHSIEFQVIFLNTYMALRCASFPSFAVLL